MMSQWGERDGGEEVMTLLWWMMMGMPCVSCVYAHDNQYEWKGCAFMSFFVWHYSCGPLEMALRNQSKRGMVSCWPFWAEEGIEEKRSCSKTNDPTASNVCNFTRCLLLFLPSLIMTRGTEKKSKRGMKTIKSKKKRARHHFIFYS